MRFEECGHKWNSQRDEEECLNCGWSLAYYRQLVRDLIEGGPRKYDFKRAMICIGSMEEAEI